LFSFKQILPRTLTEFKGGAELIESIESLTAKVDLLKAKRYFVEIPLKECQINEFYIVKLQIEYQKENGGGNGSTLSRVFDDLEIKQLLRPGEPSFCIYYILFYIYSEKA
jgi:hypothetical protein